MAVLDGFGLAMFLPLLQVSSGEATINSETMGSLQFIIEGLQNLNIPLTLTSVLLVILVFFSLKGIARFFESYYKTIVRQYFIKKIRFDNVDKLSNLKYKAFVLSDSGKVQNTMSGEVARLAQAYQSYMSTVQDGVMVFVYVILAFLSNAGFALLVAGGGVLSNLAYKKIYEGTKKASKNVSHDGHVFQGLLIQYVANFKYLKATALIHFFTKRLKEYIGRIEDSNKKIGFYAAIQQATREPLVVLVVVAVILVQVRFFGVSIGLIILSLMFFYRSLTYIMNMQSSWNNFLGTSGALENMTQFTQELSRHQEKFGKESYDGLQRSIELKNISFQYQNRAVLKNINLTIGRHETVAFVGESGSGKTTLVNIIAGLLPVDQGEMLVDGKPITQLHLPAWQSRIGYITQEPVIFNDNVYNNVTFWAPRTPENVDRFWSALKKAAILEFVEQLPQREDAPLGIGGILISGGQKQRLSIARELYKDVDVLIMDEATSSLDSETEAAIQDNIDRLKGSYTILIIAHRLATVKGADKIIHLWDGCLLEEGSFKGLFSESKAFQKIVNLQELLS